MNALRVDEAERQRLLQVMGFDVWVRRGSEPIHAVRTPVPVAKAPVVGRAVGSNVPTPEARRAPPAAPIRSAVLAPSDAPTPARAAPRAPSTSRMATQSVLLVLEKRLHADLALVRHLMLALPGCTICTADTVPRGAAKFALQLGVDASLPADVLGVRAPALDTLRQSASARRSLWWSIKPLLKALRG